MTRRYRFAQPYTPMCCIRCYVYLALSLAISVALFVWAVTP